MILLPQRPSPLDDVWVALDLETTGLSAQGDDIIEVGAVRFQGRQVLDSFQTFVNPNRRLNEFVQGYTGITQAEVNGAPPFSRVAGGLASFIGATPIVGHNVAFDLGFLQQKGLKLPNPRCDTWDLAFVLLPGLEDYSLPQLARTLEVAHLRPHRAIEDAVATKEVFLKLLAKLAAMDVYALNEMQHLASRSGWILSYLLGQLSAGPGRYGVAGQPATLARSAKERRVDDAPTISITGLDSRALGRRLQSGRALRPNQQVQELDVESVAALLKERSPLSKAIPGFEERPEQIAMARAVSEAINRGGRLIVEAGTGVGKSMAYLLPALLYASMNNTRVVVSTNTINLQEQLLSKDIPALVAAIGSSDGSAVQGVRFTQLKGRANYLCLKRLSRLRSSETLSPDEARLLAKTLLWLQTTATGDRGELNLGHRSAAAPWESLSAQGAVDCMGSKETCFLRAARERAAASHLVVVNHALLLSDLMAGGSLIPEYDILIVDEGHHLEDEATRHLGFELGQGRCDEHLRSLGGERGLLNGAVSAFRGASAAATRRTAVEKIAAEMLVLIPRVRDGNAQLFFQLAKILDDAAEVSIPHGQELRITVATRSRPAWTQLEVQWENADLLLSGLGTHLGKLRISLEGLEEANLLDYEGLMGDLARVEQTNAELRQQLGEFIPQPKADGIYWLSRPGNGSDLALHAAPLNVDETLNRLLFSQKRCVVMTSATLSTNGSFEYLCRRMGFAPDDELLVGSPFDYPNAALLCVPEDMPEPSSRAYQVAAEQAITDTVLAAGGRTMALFTSYASLQTTASGIRENLHAHGINVLAQGADGTPAQLVRRFLDTPNSVLLGTASFWEGVDLAGDSLQVLLVMRLPFSVPSEPVFASRSELYEDPFSQYAVPQAILRLRQGFGRLIRTKTDRGVVVILDRRITSRGYGKAFLDSLPPVGLKRCRLRELRNEIHGWIGT